MPETSTVQIRGTMISDQLVDGMIKFLEGLFAERERFTWDSDETKSRIIIHDFEAFNLDSVDKRPRIAVELLEFRWSNLAIDNTQKYSFQGGFKDITDLVQASLTLHCISPQSLEAKNLADTVFEGVRIFREELRKETGFFDVDSLSVGREQRVKTSSQPEVRVVPVSLGIKLQRSHTKILDRTKFDNLGL